MYHDKKIIAIIPARFGSQGLAHKNLKKFQDIPLFMHSVKYAFESKYVDDVLVSSDSEKILKIAHENGCLKNKLRPKRLSSDTARTVDVILWELKNQKQKYDAVCLLQPTSPLRPKGALDKAIASYFKKETSLISVVKCHTQPEFIRYIGKDQKLHKIVKGTADLRRQDFIQDYEIVGSIYINNVHTLTKDTVLNENKIPFILDEYYGLDIDTSKDWNELKKRDKENN